MNAAQSVAFRRFLATLSPAQRAELLDVIGSHCENMRADHDEDGPSEFMADVEAVTEQCIAGQIAA